MKHQSNPQIVSLISKRPLLMSVIRKEDIPARGSVPCTFNRMYLVIKCYQGHLLLRGLVHRYASFLWLNSSSDCHHLQTNGSFPFIPPPDLRKLNQKLVRSCPKLSLQFLWDTLSRVQAPLSSAKTSQTEAALLRLIFYYCEGVRPPPGIKVIMRNEIFRSVLIVLHSSKIAERPHRYVLILYYDTVVRYSSIFKEIPVLLTNVLSSISGDCGLQHQHPRVRSRSCYLLLKLIKALSKH